MRSNYVVTLLNISLFALILVSGAPSVRAAHPEIIVTPAWVYSLQQFHTKKITTRPATFKNKRFVVLETGWGKLSEAKDYRAGHVRRGR